MLPASVGVIFDMDGVLADSAAAHLESWRVLARELGADVEAGRFERVFGQRSADIIRELFGAGRSEEEIARLDDRKECIYRDLIRGRVPIMPGARELLTALRAAGARLAVGSSGPRENVELVLDALADAARFDAVVTGFDVTRGKPDPQTFLIAAGRLGLPVDRCVVIEDAPAGIEAARRAGMRAIRLVGAEDKRACDGAAREVRSLFEITVSGIAELAHISG